EAEYVAAASCCGQVLWIQNQMLDYGFNFMNTKIYIDNESTICIVKNPVYHSKTKHIAIRHHFIRDAYEKKLIQVLKIHTDDNVADLLTKAFDVSRFQFLVVSIGMFLTMAVLDSCLKHNMVAYLEKSEGNVEFHESFDYSQCKTTNKVGKHFSGKVTPLFATMLVQPTQDEGASSERPSEALPTPSPAPTSEVPHEPQTDSSPAQTSEVPIEHQPNLSPRPSPTTTIPDSIPETSGENLGGHSSSDKSLSGNEGDMTLQSVYDLCLSLCAQVSDQAKEIQDLKAQITKLKKQAKPVIKHHKAYLKSVSLKQRFPRKSFSKKHRVHKESVSKQGRKFAKGESSVQRDPLFDEIPEDTVDHMETENAQNEGRTREMVDEDKEIDENILSTEDVLSTDMEKVSTDRPIVSTDGSKVSTEEQVESTDGHKKGTEEEIATQATQTSTQTPTSTIFGDDETIAKVLLNMSQAKAVSREKEKGVELKDVEETDRPKPTSTRSLLTLKPLPKIDPKDKGKKKIKEDDESESESDGIPKAEKKFKLLESDEEMARKNNKKKQGLRQIDFMLRSSRQEREQFTIEERSQRNFKHPELKIKKLRKYKLFAREIKSKAEVQKESKEEESTKKRKLGIRKKMKSRKRRYIQNTSEDDSDKENDNEQWKTECLGTKPQTDQAEHFEEINLNVVIRSNGQKRYFSTLMSVLSIFDREDLNAVYQLVMDRFQDEIPEGFDRVLWGDLMVMFNPDDENEFWNSQQDWHIVSWKLHGSSGVHTLVTETELVIHMLVEKKYPLRKEVLMQMLKLKLESEEDMLANHHTTNGHQFTMLNRHKNWLVHKQTACGKDFSNPFMVDNLPKIVRFSTHLASVVKSWLVHDQTVHALLSKSKRICKDKSIPLKWFTVVPKLYEIYSFRDSQLRMMARKFYQRTGRKIIIDGSNTAGYDKSKVECFNCHKMGHFARECRAPRSKDNKNWNQGSSSKAVKIEDASEKAIYYEVTNDKSCSKSCLKNYEALKKQYDDLLVKLDDTGFKASTYKRGELEKVKLEKEGFEFKIAKFEKSAKDLDHLEEFKQPEVNEYGPRATIGCDKESDNSKENTDDSLKQQQMTDTQTSSVKSSLQVDKDWKEKFFYPANHVRVVEPEKARENNDAPIIED
ncbi:putative ribonuclease H-like domain-containing protein, partial [Tanacetum coccineum]